MGQPRPGGSLWMNSSRTARATRSPCSLLSMTRPQNTVLRKTGDGDSCDSLYASRPREQRLNPSQQLPPRREKMRPAQVVDPVWPPLQNAVFLRSPVGGQRSDSQPDPIHRTVDQYLARAGTVEQLRACRRHAQQRPDGVKQRRHDPGRRPRPPDPAHQASTRRRTPRRRDSTG